MRVLREFYNVFISSLVGLFIIAFMLMLNLLLFPLPEEMDTRDLESIVANIKEVSDFSCVLVILSYILASYCAGYISSKIRTRNPVRTLYFIGVILTLAGFVFFIVLEFPLYVVISGSVIFFPFTRLGGHVGLPKREMKF